MDKDYSTRKRKKSIEDSFRNVKKSMKNGSGMHCYMARLESLRDTGGGTQFQLSLGGTPSSKL